MSSRWFSSLFLLLCVLSFQLQAAIKPWPLVGSARLEVLWFDVYDANLYSPSGDYQEDQPLLLKLTYLRDFTAEELIDETRKQWSSKVSNIQSQRWLSQLTEFWPDIQQGQTLSFLIDEEGHGLFYFQDNYVGKVADADFSRLFIDIWLAKDSDYPKLASKLRGEARD